MKKQNSLKWNLAKYLIGFAVITLFVIILFQIVLLQPMFEASKIRSIREVARNVQMGLESDNFNEFISSMQTQSDTCILVYKDSSIASASSNSDNGCVLSSLSDETVASYIKRATKAPDKSYLARINMIPVRVNASGNAKMDTEESFRTIVYTKIVDTPPSNAIIMVAGSVSPLNGTTGTLYQQLIFVGIFLIIAVAFLTVVLYKKIAKPLAMINESAKNLSKGIYEPDPRTNQYLEACELNQTLSEAAEDIRKADKAKRDLISNVSHDLRTPLTMISGYGEMMMDMPEEKTDENIQVIIDESKRLSNLVNDLLDLSRLQENKVVLEKENFDITELIKNQLKKYEYYHLKENFKFESYLAGPIYVYADHKRIEQVLNNFITNAINYGGEAKRVIIREEVQNDVVHISVQDFGEGISKEDVENIWDRYYKIDKQHIRVSNGSGIGLAIVKQLLDLHRAKYGVISEKNVGSTFWFELPIVSSQSSDRKSSG